MNRGTDAVRGTTHAMFGTCGEAPLGHHQPAPAAIERVVFVAAMTEGLVLHPTSALVQGDVREMDDVIRIGDLGGVGEHRVEHHPIRTGQVQRRPTHPVTPRLGWGSEPCAHRVEPIDDIEQLATFHVDDLGRPALPPVAALTLVERLVQPDRRDRGGPLRIIDQHLSEQHHEPADLARSTSPFISDTPHPYLTGSATPANATVDSVP